MTDFTFVTYSGLPDLDPDDRLACDLLQERGVTVKPAVWNDPGVSWEQAGICILRSTWDYNLHFQEFMRWAEHVASQVPVYNSIELVRWNTHKSYLRDLAEKGVPVVTTRWLPRGERIELRRLLAKERWEKAVVKPAIGLSTYGVKIVDAGEDSQTHLDRLLADYDVMLQPYKASVETYGERALVYIAGIYSHAVYKTAFQPLLPAGEAGERAVEATGAEIQVASSAVEAAPAPPLYARVDLVADDDGLPLVLEMELVEPSLFLGMHPRAASRFADALMRLPRVSAA